jgi:glutamate-5-semialdehyde dehydrogenase
MQESLELYCQSLAHRARAAAQVLAETDGAGKDRWLGDVAAGLCSRSSDILKANDHDLRQATDLGLADASVDRLRLTETALERLAAGLEEVAALPNPVGRVLEGKVRPNGLEIQKLSVPLGVIFFIYESRPNVTIDAAALCVKSGNAIILRGGKEAQTTNEALCTILRDCLAKNDLPPDAVQLVATPDRAAVGHLLKMQEAIDLVIPRGGESLIRRVDAEATMPVLKHYKGNCHVYVDQSADREMAERIVVNSKCQRPSVCNAAESLLIHRAVAALYLPPIAAALLRQGVELRGCDATRRLVPDAGPATDDDYAAEFLELVMSVKVVDGVEAAIQHINRFGSKHTDAIITRDIESARRFTRAVDSAAVMVNASTRFHDGFEFGLGAEIGISTDKFHARGPCGLAELTSYKYVVYGNGQVRDS